MSSITRGQTLYLVSDPLSKDYTLSDVLWECDLDSFFRMCKGTNNTPSQENWVIYDNKEEALEDAKERMSRFGLTPNKEGVRIGFRPVLSEDSFLKIAKIMK